MRYYYGVFDNGPIAVCFNSKKYIINYAKDVGAKKIDIYFNKKDLPAYVKEVCGNGICANNKRILSNFYMTYSLAYSKKIKNYIKELRG